MFGKAPRKSFQHRFESEVHIGLLLIIFVLLFVAFCSNLVIYRSRVRLTDEWSSRLESTSVLIGREVQEYFPGAVPDSALSAICQRHDLVNLFVVSTGPENNSEAAKRKWLAAIAGTVPPARIADFAEKLFTAEIGELSKQSDGSYSLITSPASVSRYPCMIITAKIPELSYFDHASEWILILTALAVFFIGGLYFYLSRFIFAPFRKIRQKAEQAGRSIDLGNNDAEGVVLEYQRVIDDLHANQEELLRLNAEIKTRADSLEQFNEYILKSTESGMLTVDTSGRVLAINENAIRLLGFSDTNMACQLSTTLPKNHPLELSINKALREQQAAPYREEDWSGKTVGISMSFVRNEQSQIVGLWLLLFDLSETTDLRKELESRHRLSALGEMAGGLAHQLRNSMGAISGYASLVKKSLQKAGEHSEQADSLIEETRQANELIKRFLSFARPLEFEPTDVVVPDLVSEIVAALAVRPDYAKTSIATQIECSSHCRAKIDPLLFKQALSNLIDNASIAYDNRVGHIVVTVSNPAGDIVISVRDRGRGIPADKLDKVFTPFYSSRPDGTGLGLPLAARIAQMHNGRLTLQSSSGNGTTANLTIPAIIDRTVSQSAPAGAAVS